MSIKLPQSKSYNDIFACEPVDLFFWLDDRFVMEIPTILDSPDELREAGNRLGELTNGFAYLMSMVTLANIRLRNMKLSKADKTEINDMVGRRDALQNAADIVKAQYTALSRMITVKKQADEEIKML